MKNNKSLFFLNRNKYRRLRAFFSDLPKNEIFVTRNFKKMELLKAQGIDRLYLWGKGNHPLAEQFAIKNKIPVYRMEDGFIRSLFLGSDLARPYSITIDSVGIYFDPSQESELERLLNHHTFSQEVLARAKLINRTIIEGKLSKYNHQKHDPISCSRKGYDKVVLIPGQVEDDCSIILGGFGMTNEKLILETRKSNPYSFIIYKPHPDVVVGNRKGQVDTEILRRTCNLVIENSSIDTCLEAADEVHTITSFCGFDALLRDKKVFTYGMPFYAGWGLTTDRLFCQRRVRRLSKFELIAGTLLLFPKYVDVKTGLPCELEAVLERIIAERQRYEASSFYRYACELKHHLFRVLQLNHRKSRKIPDPNSVTNAAQDLAF
jgi:capsular polysaccharide export protein